MAHTISFQYLAREEDMPRAGYEITDAEFDVPQDAHVPRIGEFIQLVTAHGATSYLVQAVHTRIITLPGQAPGWHTFVTVGPIELAADERLTHIRE